MTLIKALRRREYLLLAGFVVFCTALVLLPAEVAA